MNLQCPNCQKMLQVPEQYAGQLMKCPLCQGTFTLPALAPAAEAPPVNAAAATAVPPATDPLAGLGAAPTPVPEPLPSVASSSPSFSPADGYRRHHTIWFNSEVLQYVAPISVVLIFILQFFAWVGIYPGGVPVVTQGAWGAAFGSYSVDRDLESSVDRDLKPYNPFKEEKEKPGASVLSIFYLLFFVLVALPLTVAVLVLVFVPVRLPPGLQAIWPWRWAIVAAVNALVFLFLLLQLIVGFRLESTYEEIVDSRFPAKEVTTPEQKQLDVQKGQKLAELHRTLALRLVVVLHVLAIIGATMVYCLSQRGTRPLPKLELLW